MNASFSLRKQPFLYLINLIPAMQKILDHDMSQTIKFRRVELSSHKCTCKSKVQNVLKQSALFLAVF